MRYNSYRQYVTLNGVKRENKLDIIKNLKPFVKNIVRYMPKTEYEKMVQGADLVNVVLHVNTDNTIRDAHIITYQQFGEEYIQLKKFDVQTNKLCYFNGLMDADPDDSLNKIAIYAFTSSDQLLQIQATRVNAASSVSKERIDCTFAGPVTEVPGKWIIYYQTHSTTAEFDYVAEVPITARYITYNLNITGMAYEEIPQVLVTYFE